MAAKGVLVETGHFVLPSWREYLGERHADDDPGRAPDQDGVCRSGPGRTALDLGSRPRHQPGRARRRPGLWPTAQGRGRAGSHRGRGRPRPRAAATGPDRGRRPGRRPGRGRDPGRPAHRAGIPETPDRGAGDQRGPRRPPGAASGGLLPAARRRRDSAAHSRRAARRAAAMRWARTRCTRTPSPAWPSWTARIRRPRCASPTSGTSCTWRRGTSLAWPLPRRSPASSPTSLRVCCAPRSRSPAPSCPSARRRAGSRCSPWASAVAAS